MNIQSSSKEYNEVINYPSLIFILINKVNFAIEEKRETGTFQIAVLLKNIPPEIKKDLSDDVNIINKNCEELQTKLKESWTEAIGHASNNKRGIKWTTERSAAIAELRTMANLDILELIMSMLYIKNMLLTNNNSMPSSLV
jgi:hypothetical protein